MNSINVGWRKQISNQRQFFPNKPSIEQYPMEELKSQGHKSGTKTVRFNSHLPSVKEQAFETTDYDQSRICRSQTSNFEHFYITSSSVDIFADEISIMDGKQICSVRATIITFIIVVLIILAAAMSVGIVIGTTGSGKKSTGTGNNNQNSLSTISTAIIASSVSIGSQNGTPCTSYTTINDPTRSIANSAIYSTCDDGPLFNTSNGGSWIRFVGTGGTIIPITSPGRNHCGGFLAGWFNDTLPTTVGNAVNGTVCFDNYLYSCIYLVEISVTNCGGFYIYFLPIVKMCNSRYCTS